MSLHKEIEFENDICAHLAAHDWLYQPARRRLGWQVRTAISQPKTAPVQH